MSKILNEKIIRLVQLAPVIYKMTIESEQVSNSAVPGQFVNIKCCDGINALLRRPISICNVDKEVKTFDIVFQLKGKGTELLAAKQLGDTVDLLGPLGNNFDLDTHYENIAVVGGGIGIFPLLFILCRSKATKKSTYLGFRNKDFIVLEEEFRKASDEINITTDDGSEGIKGLVTDILENDLQKSKPDIIYACGPTPMIKQAVKLAQQYDIPCQVSMEQRMGCGIGACLVCACKTKSEDGWKYSHICKDGPVFWSKDVIFD